MPETGIIRADMMARWLLFLALTASILRSAAGLPTWPSSVDELEDIMFLNTGYQARAFPDTITPCNFSQEGPSRIGSAEWLRTAFHDMATGNVLTGIGGLDASLQYELGGNGGENIGSAFNSTLATYGEFFSSRASMADLIAMGVYASVRVCGGPIIPIRTGRIDATEAGAVGVPQPQNSQYTFIQQFARMGFNTSEMIALTACGHTIGGVHAGNFPEVVKPGTVANDYQHFDSTTSFDEKIASSYANGTSTDPLAGTLARQNTFDSDNAVFTADNNVTIKKMASPSYFQSRCQTMLQRMIEVVPSGVSLTDAITPYEVKPSNLQLTVQPGGTELQFTGRIRIRTTNLPANSISNVQLVYVDRNGASTCGSCTISTLKAGTANGFDDSFIFYEFSTTLSAASSISAFKVQVTASGDTVTYDNNGKGFPIQDNVLFQSPQSCVSTKFDASGKQTMTVTAAVRGSIPGNVTLSVEVKTPRSCCVVPGLSTANVTMQKSATIGSYILYAGTYSLTSDQITSSKFSIFASNYSDSFKDTALTGECGALNGSTPVSSSSSSSSSIASTSSAILSSSTVAPMSTTSSSKSTTVASSSSVSSKPSTSSTAAVSSTTSITIAPVSSITSSTTAPVSSTASSTTVPPVTTSKSTVTSASVSTNAAQTGWISLGCYNDTVAARVLSHNVAVLGGPTNMTVENCEAACKAGGWAIAGVEYSGECYCDSQFRNYGTTASDGNAGCTMTCNGAPKQSCGGPNRLNVYSFASTTSSIASSTMSTPTTPTSTTSSIATLTTSTQKPTTPTSTTVSAQSSSTAPAVTSATVLSGWVSMGCYNDSVASRVLSYNANVQGGPTNVSVESCEAACFKAGYIYAGVEYSGECRCDSTIRNYGATATAGCTMTCSGNPTEMCGGANRQNMFRYYSTATTVGQSPSTSTVVTSVSLTIVTSTSSTVVLSTSSTLVTSTSSTGVASNPSTVVPSAPTAPSASGSVKDGPTITSSPTTSTASSIISVTSVSPTASGLPVGWSYQGCYVDNNAYGRIMINQQNDDHQLTIETCIADCAALNYTVAGMEYSYQCFCDNYLRNNASLASSNSQCAMTCAGNTKEVCGGPNLLSIYSTGKVQVLPVPTQQTKNLPGNWVYKGCLQDNVNGTRTFPYQLIYQTNNSATTCLSRCQAYGFPAGGMEYGQQCFCGDPSDIGPGVQFVPDSKCNMLCTGENYYCGAGNLISYYEWEGTPLYKWNYASGNDAGQYKFLIGGVVVPLMTTVNINGKVTFLEKVGTGPANTTGAYEFDPYYENDFDKAWRPMHIKTDIFCSAGLVLPDKAGRQLTIGGWSGVSTEGVRLYWPDGSPGNASVNDWQENANELSLQNGRWYPSSMIMANGSILVVGGETGSNGPPVPTIEILPQVGPTLYMDWLKRTDPNNLYPFIAVLPSKTVLAAYYNEARLLDEVTFETVRTLPNMPGAVNNDAGGRTYPLEGTMMFFPQYAPYTDPVRVLVCGGSTPYAGDALDSCLSIQPDVPGQNWTLERMPSKRVMSCMTPLPDGTFLILNGAVQGVAGFGLATQPNFNAILYDPSKPVNQRMTVMANTTIARLYHSEAVLMPDGRVLVSGSDPEEPSNPQEYRVEVFLPPYILSGAPRPAYTIADNQKDWSYGSSHTITVTAGNVANLKVSLIGVISTTHGNSFGHRTFFPAFSCSGNQCTITAPPDQWTCPPGWFHLFILDGSTPSVSTFVRIGGDPGKLGNWPNLPDFKVPGI